MKRLALGAGLAAAILGTWGGAAAAQWSAVVVDFEGRGTRQTQNAVVRVVEDRVTLKPAREFASAAEAAGHDLATAGGLTEAARAQSVTLVITGRVRGSSPNLRAVVRFLDAGGEELSSAEVSVPRDQSARQRFNREVTAAFDQALGILDERAAAERSEELDDDRAEVVGLDDEMARDADEEPTGTGMGTSASGSSRYPFVRGLVGLDGRSRDASFELQNGLKKTYQAVYPQLTLTLEVRPFAGDQEVLGGFFFTFDGAAAIGLTSNEELSSGAVVPIETSSYRFGFELGYLFDLETVELGASLGFVYDAFELAPNNTIPTTAYSSLRIGLIGRLPILEEQLLALFVDGGLRILVGTGSLSPVFSESSSGVGFDVTGGVRGALDFGLTYAARIGYIGYAVGFSGNAANIDDTASSGFDGGVYFGAQVGWQL